MRTITLQRFAALMSMVTFVFPCVVNAATELQLSPHEINVQAGQSFSLTATAAPADTKSYTVKYVFKYPAEFVRVYKWVFAPVWIPIRESNYDELDNAAGEFIRTAGYPGGFSGSTLFGTVTFVAKKTGKATIQIGTESMVLDGTNTNIATAGAPVNVTITPAPVIVPAPVTTPQQTPAPTPTPLPTPAPTPTPTPISIPTPTPLPEVQPIPVPTTEEPLLNIKMQLVNPTLENSKDLTALTQFSNVNNVTTTVDLTYKVMDVSGREVSRSGGIVNVGKEKVDIKRFTDLNIASGSYSLVAVVTYGGKTEDFTEDFIVQGAVVVPEVPVVETPIQTPTTVGDIVPAEPVKEPTLTERIMGDTYIKIGIIAVAVIIISAFVYFIYRFYKK